MKQMAGIIILGVLFLDSFAYNKPQDAFSIGDRRMVSANYRLWGTTGLPVEKMASSNYILWGGFVLPTGVEELVNRCACKFYLSQSYPNPAVFTTYVEYGIAKPTNVTICIYDITGRVIRTLVCGKQMPGIYRVQWNLTDNNGNRVSPGVYFCRMQASHFVAVKKLTVLR